MTKKKMSGIKLSQFSGIKTQPENLDSPPLEAQPEIEQSSPKPEPVPETLPPATLTVTSTQEAVAKEKPVTINIKISRAQHEWLTDTARTIRDNNDSPVPPGDRVYPQHLIGVAIDLLQAKEIDWSQVKNVEDLKRLLNI